MSSTLSSVTKALEILHALRRRGPMRVTQIAQEIGVSSSSAHRLVSTLREQRFVRQESGSKRYELGSAMLFSSEVTALEHCVAVSRALMEDLQAQTGETVHLSVLRGKACLFASSVESQRRVRVTSRVGQDPLAHTAAGGKVLLAALAADRLSEVYLHDAFAAGTPAAVTSRDALVRELGEVRAQGYARNLGESEPDMYAIAVPVRRPNGEIISSLTIAAPLSRIDAAPAGSELSLYEQDLLRALRSAGLLIEARLAF